MFDKNALCKCSTKMLQHFYLRSEGTMIQVVGWWRRSFAQYPMLLLIIVLLLIAAALLFLLLLLVLVLVVVILLMVVVVMGGRAPTLHAVHIKQSTHIWKCQSFVTLVTHTCTFIILVLVFVFKRVTY